MCGSSGKGKMLIVGGWTDEDLASGSVKTLRKFGTGFIPQEDAPNMIERRRSAAAAILGQSNEKASCIFHLALLCKSQRASLRGKILK